MSQLSNKFCTSFFTEKTVLEIVSCHLRVKQLPSDKAFDEIMIYISDQSGKTHKKEYLKRVGSHYKDYTLPKVPDGMYYLILYRKATEEDNMFYSFIHGVDIPLLRVNGMFFFPDSDVLEQNRKFIQSIRVDKQSLQTYTKPSYAVQSYDSDIREKARTITRFSHNDYHKVLAIHNWIARSLYYDYDSLEKDAYKSMKISAVSTLSTGKSVCQGYTELAVAMLRSVGIPAIGVVCYAIDSDTKDGWKNPICHSETNHIFAMAYVDNRWVIMDSTWDSTNRFENKKFINIGSNGIFTKHFDMTLPFVSNTHRFSEVFI